MTHISRPFQIALAALVLFLAVWFVALRGHSSGIETSGSGSSSPAGAPAASTPSSSASAQSAPGGGSPASKGGVYHGSAPGVEGLSRAIQRARGAVAQSQQNAKRQESGQSSGNAGGSPGQSQTQSAQAQAQRAQAQGAQTRTSQSRSAQHSAARSTKSQHVQRSQQSKSPSGVPAMQAVVESELKHGKAVVAVLFWNPKGAVDATVRRELSAARHAEHGKLAVHVARAGEVGLFGSFTRTVQVYSTPTILLVNRAGKTSSLTGLADAFSIEQAIKEVKRAK